MKTISIICFILVLSASAAPALAAEGKDSEAQQIPFSGVFGPSYNWVKHSGNERAGEYEYLKSSPGADLYLEYDPLPHRFELDTHVLNEKDYFGEMSYAFRDVVVVNVLARSVNHNLDHLQASSDDPSTPSPSITDRNPGDHYAIENTMRRAFVRLKVPDFPLHFFTEISTVDRSGAMQQRFLREYSGGANRILQSRTIDGQAREARVGLNSHLGPIEAEYYHTDKRYDVHGDKMLFETYSAFTAPHNAIADLSSTSDTVKVHTSYPGRVVAAATYSKGDKKNADSHAKADYKNAAGDIVLTPVGGLVVVFKYRQYQIDAKTPATVTLSGVGSTYAIRTPLSSKRDIMSGIVSYRATSRMTLKGDYTVETVQRQGGSGLISPLQISPTPTGTASDAWDVAHKTTKVTERLGMYYHAMKVLTLRADFRAVQVENPAYASDPDKVNAETASMTWTPGKGVIVLASYGGTQEKRSDMSAPLGGGSRKTNRDQALGSLTVPVGNRASVTISYLYFRTKTKETLTFADTVGTYTLEDGVPYGDTAHIGSLAASFSPADGVALTADASRCSAKGNFRLSGAVTNSSGIDILSDMKIVEDILNAGIEWSISKTIGSSLKYQYRHYDDRINSLQDGRVNSTLAALNVKW